MGRTGDSLDDEFPPRIGGKKPSPRGAPCREEAGWPWVKMIDVVVVVVVVVVVCCFVFCLLLSSLTHHRQARKHTKKSLESLYKTLESH